MMIKIKLDENLGRRGKDILIEAGFDTETVFDENLCSSSDHHLIQVCQDEKRILVTLDLDFANPFVFDPTKYYGIAVIRLHKNPKPNELYNCIKTLVKGLLNNDIHNKLWIIEEKSIREYQKE